RGASGSFAEAQPRFNAAFISFVAVMVENPMDPGATNFSQRTIRKNRGVFARNIFLIIKTVRDPAAQLFSRKPAFIHRDVKRMLVVVGTCTDRAQFADKFSRSHSSKSIPSAPTRMPASAISFRSSESG